MGYFDKYEVTWRTNPIDIDTDHTRHFANKADAETFARNMRDDPAIKKLELWGVRRTLLIEESGKEYIQLDTSDK